MDTLQWILLEKRKYGGVEEAPSTESAEPRQTQTWAIYIWGALFNAMGWNGMKTDLKTISRFAQLEYKYGDPERGRTLFEGIVDSHPKRWDLWSIYMDMEGVQKNIQGLRYALSKPFVYTNYIYVAGTSSNGFWPFTWQATKRSAQFVTSDRPSLMLFFGRSFFKKWLELEKRIGDEEGVSDVKTKAVEWTRRASNAQQ